MRISKRTLTLVSVSLLLFAFLAVAPQPASAQLITFPGTYTFMSMPVNGTEVLPYNQSNIRDNRVNLTSFTVTWTDKTQEEIDELRSAWSYVTRGWAPSAMQLEMEFGTPDGNGVVDITIPIGTTPWHSIWDNVTSGGVFWCWRTVPNPSYPNGWGKLYTQGNTGDVDMTLKANYSGSYPTGEEKIWFWKGGAYHSEDDVVADHTVGIGDGTLEPEPGHMWYVLPAIHETWSGRETAPGIKLYSIPSFWWYNTKYAYCIVDYPSTPNNHPLHGYSNYTDVARPLDVDAGTFTVANAYANIDAQTPYGPNSNLWASSTHFELAGRRVTGDASGPAKVGDGIVNVFDVFALAAAWLTDDSSVYLENTTAHGPANPDRFYLYNPMVDFSSPQQAGRPEGIINVFDVFVVAAHWLETGPVPPISP